MPTMTAAQRRLQSKLEYDAYLAQCPSRQLLARISEKWVALTLAALGTGGARPGDPDAAPGALRYSELARHVSGVSPKMLTQTLRSLERDGLVTRTVTPSVPVAVTYELTELGVSLQRLMSELKSWAELHMAEVLVHRDQYDASHQTAPSRP